MVRVPLRAESVETQESVTDALGATAQATWVLHDDRHELRAGLVLSRPVVRRGPPVHR